MITEVLLAPGWGAYYVEDLAALQKGPMEQSLRYRAQAVTPSFRYITEPAEILSVGLRLDDGRVAWGDCVGVSYGGKAGRDPVFRAAQATLPDLTGTRLTNFKDLSNEWAKLEVPKAILYGLSQALVAAFALKEGCSMAEVWCRAFDLPIPNRAIPLHGSSGNARKKNADKMILRKLASLPAGQVDNLEAQVGLDGQVLLDYARWLRHRILEFGEGYQPTVHLDVHGALGRIFDDDKLLEYLDSLAEVLAPFPLRMESVVVEASLEAQIERLSHLHERLERVELVVDEWANTLEDVKLLAQSGCIDMVHLKVPDLGSLIHTMEAIKLCQDGGIKTLLGGSCIETEISTKASVHLALAAQPDLLMCKPGMGVDEAIMLTSNEMERTLLEIGRPSE